MNGTEHSYRRTLTCRQEFAQSNVNNIVVKPGLAVTITHGAGRMGEVQEWRLFKFSCCASSKIYLAQVVLAFTDRAVTLSSANKVSSKAESEPRPDRSVVTCAVQSTTLFFLHSLQPVLEISRTTTSHSIAKSITNQTNLHRSFSHLPTHSSIQTSIQSITLPPNPSSVHPAFY